MKKLYTAILCLFVLVSSSHAQFSGAYAPSKWTTTLSAGSDGSVNSSGAPNSIIIRGSDGAGGTNVDTDYTIVTIAGGIWSFNWSYHTNDTDLSPAYDLAGVMINGVFTQLTNNGGDIDQSGTYSGAFIPAGATIGFRIRATDNTMGDATMTITSFSPPGGVLPLQLQQFTAKEQVNGVKLQWKTANEVNVSNYEVQRSWNGVEFSPITNVMAQNGMEQQYQYLDQSPANGTNYYRLRMVDTDGSFSYSSVVTVNRETSHALRVYPVPAGSQLNIEIRSGRDVKEEVQIYDAAGRQVISQTVNIRQGAGAVSIDLSKLGSGYYFLRTVVGGQSMGFVKN